MKNISIEETKTQIRIFKNDKHVKSFPRFFSPVIEMIIDKVGEKLDEKRKRLTAEDYELISKECFSIILSDFHDRLRKTEKYVYELIEKAEYTAARIVKSKSGERFEIIYSNNVKIKVDKDLYKLAPNKQNTAFLNY